MCCSLIPNIECDQNLRRECILTKTKHTAGHHSLIHAHHNIQLVASLSPHDLPKISVSGLPKSYANVCLVSSIATVNFIISNTPSNKDGTKIGLGCQMWDEMDG